MKRWLKFSDSSVVWVRVAPSAKFLGEPMNRFLAALVSLFVSTTVAASPTTSLSGTVKVDGSSTVYPITEAVSEEFGAANPSVKVPVGISGTGGGFEKFCRGELDVVNASRAIKEKEKENCGSAQIEYLQLPIAYDAITVVVNPKNTWVQSITVQELKTLWEPAAQGKIMKWSQVRAGWPDTPVHLFGPGADSGTFDYFTEVIVGKEDASRGDFTSSEDDNVLVKGVESDVNALGFFGIAYYNENKAKLRVVPVDDGKSDNGDGPIHPSIETVLQGQYLPLSRPLFIYVRKDSLNRPEVNAFANFYVENAKILAREVGYVPLKDSSIAETKALLKK
jgi:phosphate transport system substrate-binding protein